MDDRNDRPDDFRADQAQAGEERGEERGLPSWAASALGLLVAGAVVYGVGRAVLGRSRAAPREIAVRKSVTVGKPPEELYRHWRSLEHLPQVMRHLESVRELGGGRSHWVAKAPLGRKVAWDAELTEELENRRLAWRSVGSTPVPNEGSVEFEPAPGGRGTEIHVRLRYRPPAGRLGARFAKLFGEEPALQIAEDLQRYKQRLEAGEVASTAGQPAGRA